jgi:hypothetical protein
MKRTPSSKEGFVQPSGRLQAVISSLGADPARRPWVNSSLPSSCRSRFVLAPLLVVLALLVLALSASAALAAETHVFSGSFGSEGSGAGQLELAEHSGVAVDESTHDVYVADTGNNRVEQPQKAPVQNPGPEQEDLQFSSKARSGCSPSGEQEGSS